MVLVSGQACHLSIVDSLLSISNLANGAFRDRNQARARALEDQCPHGVVIAGREAQVDGAEAGHEQPKEKNGLPAVFV